MTAKTAFMHSVAQVKMETSTPCKIGTLEQIDTQFVGIDYVHTCKGVIHCRTLIDCVAQITGRYRHLQHTGQRCFWQQTQHCCVYYPSQSYYSMFHLFATNS